MVRWRPDPLGVAVGLLAVLASLTPSLLPRPAVLQGVLAGLAFALGYAVGVLLSYLVRRVIAAARGASPGATSARTEPSSTPNPQSTRSHLAPATRWALGVAFVVASLLAVGLIATVAIGWQNEVRALVEVPPLDGASLTVFAVAALVTAAIGMLIGRGVRALALGLTARAGVAVATVGVVAILTTAVIALVSAAVGIVDRIYLDRNGALAEGVREPASDVRSAGADSAVAWDLVGRHGSAFLGGGPSADDIAALTGQSALDPVRVYVGLESAENLADQVSLAVEELHRTGAFDRDVLVVATTTGSGWLEAQTVDAIEYLHGGDTAIVALQYAYTPSWVSFLFDPDAPIGAATALFEAVEAEWLALPEGDRPRLISYGLSLGAHGSQAVFGELDALRDRTDGAMFVGSPAASEMWRDLQASRDPGSPVWQPVRGAGREVRWMSRPSDLDRLPGPWDEPRVLYLQHATDPITWLAPELLWSSPEWLRDDQRGGDVSPAMRWIPVITALQVTIDMLMGESVPPRHGHNFGDVVVDGWRAVTGDTDLSPAELDAIRAEIESYGYTDEED